MYLARVEEGKVAAVYQVDDRQVRMPNAGREKARAKVTTKRPRAWIFKANRSAVVAKLSNPGVAALARSEPAAIEAAMKLYSEYMQAVNKNRFRR